MEAADNKIMCWQLVRLNFGRNLAHFGELGIGLESTSERVRSDTLFSAWMSAYAKLFGKNEVGQILNKYEQNPQSAFRISSTFIYRYQDDEYTDYLPRPLVFPKGYPQDDDWNIKKVYESLKYLPLEVWHRWYQTEEGITNDLDELTEIAEARTKDEIDKRTELYKAGTFEYSENFKIALVPKVAIDRITRATSLYHTGFVKFNWEPEAQYHTGLYFLVNFPGGFDETIRENLTIALDLLGEEGIGGERSSGAGRFKPDWSGLDDIWQEILNPLNLENPHYCLISLYWQDPNRGFSNGLLGDAARYELLRRSGWISSPFSGRQLRRKSLWMFAESSVFPIPPLGEVADITPNDFRSNHSIYRSGICVSLPINQPE
ncbi:MAG: type III-A CRISPR-associated RAMP protein Csm4 [Limnoraphis robusta]|nr:type III-A CRISPR-associated RAMP protein Csm4 [Limnoraphis robusta]